VHFVSWGCRCTHCTPWLRLWQCLEVWKSDFESESRICIFYLDSKSESRVHSWRAKVLTLPLAYINILVLVCTTVTSVTWPAFPEPDGDSITDIESFSGHLRAWHCWQAGRSSASRVIWLNIHVGPPWLLVPSDVDNLSEAFNVKHLS